MSERIDKEAIQVFLKHIWAFEHLEEEHLRVLAEIVRTREHNPKQILWLQGQEITHFLIVYSGRVQCLRQSSSGSEKMVSVLTPGRHFGLAEMITGVRSTMTLTAETKATILILDRKALRSLLLGNAELCYRLMQTMARAIFNLTAELEKASFETVRTRLLRLLLKETRPAPNQPTKADREVTCHISHEELAMKLGISRETVSRTLGELRKTGLIRTGYRSITLPERSRLSRALRDQSM